MNKHNFRSDQGFLIKGFTSCGSRQSSSGIGDVSISIHRDSTERPWCDFIKIKYSDMSPDMYDSIWEKQLNSPNNICEDNPLTEHNRRLSKLQAHYLQSLICQFLNNEFPDRIPSDTEILEELQKSRII